VFGEVLLATNKVF